MSRSNRFSLFLACLLAAAGPAAPATENRIQFSESFRQKLDLSLNDEATTAFLSFAPGEIQKCDLSSFEKRARFRPFNLSLVSGTVQTILDLARQCPGVRFVDEVAEPLVPLLVSYMKQVHRLVSMVDSGMMRVDLFTLSQGIPSMYVGFGQPSGRATFQQIMSPLTDRGIDVVIAVGNDGPLPGKLQNWALGGHYLLVGSTDQTGTRVSEFSSVASKGAVDDEMFFVAPGEDVVVGHPANLPKTPQQLDAESRVSRETGRLFTPDMTVVSGTSFSVVSMTNAYCLANMSVRLFRTKISALAPIQGADLGSFVRAYIDTRVDHSVPSLQFRFAEKGQKFGSVLVEIDRDERKVLQEIFARGAVQINVSTEYRPALRILLAAVRPIADVVRERQGLGFLSTATVKDFLSDLSVASFSRLFASGSDTTKLEPSSAGQKVFQPEELDLLEAYCIDQSLILAFDRND